MSENYEFEIEFLEKIIGKDDADLAVLEMLASYYTKEGRIDEGLEIDRKIVELSPENPLSYYNLACSLSLKSKTGEAIEAIRCALEYGYNDYKWMMKDPDLVNLHKNPIFAALLAEYQIRQKLKK